MSKRCFYFIINIIICLIFFKIFLFPINKCFAEINLKDSNFIFEIYDNEASNIVAENHKLEYNEEKKWYEYNLDGKRYVALSRGYRRCTTNRV